MRARQSPIESLVTLSAQADPTERRARWRQAIAGLGQEHWSSGASILDGVPEGDLLLAVRAALETGLVDDLSWLSPGGAAVALYELSSHLPQSKERREIGRRVFARLYEGNAATFAAVATRMALGPGRPFEAATLRARIGLVFALPVGSSVNQGPLALGLVSRRELFDRWVKRAATGPLPSRRLAARVLERAAWEASRRTTQGDSRPAELLSGPLLRPLLDRLIADREPLVWRHAAAARGLLSAAVPSLKEDVDLALDPSLSPTEWRRATVSLVASIAAGQSSSIAQCERLLESELVAKDPGLAVAVVWGLSPVVESEPELASELLDRVSVSGRIDVAEAISALLSDVANPEFGADAAALVRATLAEQTVDPGMRAIYEETLRGLEHPRSLGSVHACVRRALDAYETSGARAAHEIAVEAVGRAMTTMDGVEALGHAELSALVGPLGDLDASAIEQSRLHDLLLLGRSPGDTNTGVPEIERLCDRVSRFILERESSYVESDYSRGELLARQRTLRVLLHLTDLETSGKTDGDSNDTGRARIRRTIEVLLRTLSGGPDASVHRIICATLARGLDSAARDALADPADLLLLVMATLHDATSVQAMTEASTHPDVREALKGYAGFLQHGSRDPMGSLFEITVDEAPRGEELAAAFAFVDLSRGMGTNGSHRGESLRQTVLRLGRALETVAAARGLSDLVETESGEGQPLEDVEIHASTLIRLLHSARGRVLGSEYATAPPLLEQGQGARLSSLVERAVAGVPASHEQLAAAINELVSPLPAALGNPIARVLGRIAALPEAPPSDIGVIPLKTRRAELPDWLLPRRTIGSFYVVRALGTGGVSSVFIARRLEERRTSGADLYALKVPEYDPMTARSLSEQQFLQLFREEAGALLSLPQHPNLARFVTFDLAAKPKPILVMELIRGFGLDRLIRNRSLTTPLAIQYLVGILDGLSAMHAVGVGHLDVKPSNVILRDDSTPVLVDFGLSGRHVRPGCGTLEYCAPEVLGVETPGAAPTPAAADIYAFGCTAFEVLTGTPLFYAEEEAVLMNRHLTHDGWPPNLAAFAQGPEYASVSVVLSACLRRSPVARPSAVEVRRALLGATQWLGDKEWPLGVGTQVAGLSA